MHRTVSPVAFRSSSLPLYFSTWFTNRKNTICRIMNFCRTTIHWHHNIAHINDMSKSPMVGKTFILQVTSQFRFQQVSLCSPPLVTSSIYPQDWRAIDSCEDQVIIKIQRRWWWRLKRWRRRWVWILDGRVIAFWFPVRVVSFFCM